MILDLGLLLQAFLPGVLLDSNRVTGDFGEKLIKFLLLRIDQGVHRVDEDCPHACYFGVA